MHHQNIAPHGHLEQSSDSVKNAQKVDLGVRGELKRDLTFENSRLVKGSKIIIQPLNQDKPGEEQKFIITLYEIDKSNIQADLPETARSIRPGQSYQVTFRKNDPSTRYLKFNNEHYRYVKRELFPAKESPSINEVKQMQLPNCSFLAAIQAILNHPDGASYIRGMMYQDKEGCITVRLFNPKNGQPDYFKVNSEVLVDHAGLPLNGHTALWVHALESAYAARGIKDVETIVPNKSISTVSMLITPAIAFKTLTGIDSQLIDVKTYTISPADIPSCLSEGAFQEVKGAISLNTTLGKKNSDPMLLLNVKTTIEGEVFANALLSAFPEEKDEKIFTDYAKLIVLQQTEPNRFVQIQNATPLEEDRQLALFYNKIRLLLKSVGAPFTNNYNAHQLETFKLIKQALNDEKLLVAIIKILDYPQPVVGLHSKHAYTILGTREKNKKISDTEEVPALFVTLRNPWGWSGRSYEETTTKALDDSNAGIFEIELSEFCEFFSQCIITDSVNVLFKREALKEKYLVEIEKFLSSEPLEAYASKPEIQKEHHSCKHFLENLRSLGLHVAHPHLWEKIVKREATLNTMICGTLNFTCKQGKKYATQLDELANEITGEIKIDKATEKNIKDTILVYFTLQQSYNRLVNMTIFTDIHSVVIQELNAYIIALSEKLDHYAKIFTSQDVHSLVREQFLKSKNDYEPKLIYLLNAEAPMTAQVLNDDSNNKLDTPVTGKQHFGFQKTGDHGPKLFDNNLNKLNPTGSKSSSSNNGLGNGPYLSHI